MIYGPNTLAVQSIIDRIPTLTYAEVNRLGATWAAVWDAARDAFWSAAWYAARGAANDAANDANRGAVWSAAWDAARDAAIDASRGADWYAAWYAGRDAIIATLTYDLATIDGPYTIVQRDLLLAPWVEVCGMPDGLGATLDGEG